MCMQQIIKRFFWIVLLVAGIRSALGFSLLGPLSSQPGGETWQSIVIGYDQAGVDYSGTIPGGPSWLDDIGGPHNLGEEYRRSTPVIYYAYDASFQAADYFGLEAVTNIDGAFGIINSLTNVDTYSPDLSEFPLTSQEYNYTAKGLYLTDLKSIMLHLLVEQLGLADAGRYTWTLHGRAPGPACPVTAVYDVVQRNFDIVPSSQGQVQYSPYVNGALLSYYIAEICSGPPPELSSTVPYLTDPEAPLFGPVSANTFLGDDLGLEFGSSGGLGLFGLHLPVVYGLQIGGYYTGLTRDDVAGLRYLIQTNNINYEPIPASSLWFNVVTNFDSLAQTTFPSTTATNISGTNGGFYVFDGTYGYGDYGFLVATSLTNSPAALQALYPGLQIDFANSTATMRSVTNWTFTQYFTNAGYGSTYPPQLTLVTVSNPIVVWQQTFSTRFANVFTNNVRTNTTYQLQTITVQPTPGQPYPAAPQTNVTTTTVKSSIPSGDFFLLPMFHTNVCPLDIISVGLPRVIGVTNVLSSTSTNVVTPTNSASFASTLIQVNYFTNYSWVIQPVNCGEISNAPNYYQGIGRVRFQKVEYDSILGRMNPPQTNYYSMVSFDPATSQLHQQRFVRVINQPDILIGAEDISAPNTVNFTVLRNIGFNASQIIGNLKGPGLIDAPTSFIFNKVGPNYFNGPFQDGLSYLNPSEVNETTQMPGLQWASYDGSTNVPVVYPNGTSIQEYQDQLLVQLSSVPAGPLVGTTNAPANYQFNATGGNFVPPFTWSASGHPIAQGILYGLPPGLSLSSSGLLSGTATAKGTYDFVLTLVDSNGRNVNWDLSITIN